MSSLLISLHSLAQALPLTVIMAADDGCAGLLDPTDFAKRVQQRIHIPGIAGRGIRIEIFAQAYSVRRQKKRTVPIEMDDRSHRSGGMTRQWNQDQPAVAEHIPVASNWIDRLAMVPIRPQIAGGLRARRVRGLDLPGMHQGGFLLEKRIAATMVGMEMRVHDDIDIVRVDADARQTWQKSVLRAHYRRHDFHQGAPSF